MPENIGFDCELEDVNIDNFSKCRGRASSNGHNFYPPNQDQQQTMERDGWIIRKSKSQFGCANSLIIKLIGFIILLVLMWVLLYCLFGDEVKLEGGLFKILSLSVVSLIVGRIVSLFHLPPLLGMLVTGIIFRTTGFYHISGVYEEIVIVLRETALSVILIKAGLGLDPNALFKLSLVVLRLALLPCIGEALAVAVFTHFVLGYPWLWGILLGFLLSAISPAVVVPSLLSLKERGYGEDKGISTLVIGASSLDDIAAISVFGICLGMIFSPGELKQQILQGPTELLVGLCTGILWGITSSIFPNTKDSMIEFKRCVMVGGWGLLAVIGSQEIGFPGAGPLSCVVASLTANIFWKLQGWSNQNPVADIYSNIWYFMEPILFGLIGAEIDLTKLQLNTVGIGIVVILCGIGFRVFVCTSALLGTNLNWKEKLFINLAWLPKATVQAALASKPLDTTHDQISPKEDDIEHSKQILTIAVLSILITAPLGAIGVALGGPIFLSKKSLKKKMKLNLNQRKQSILEI